MEWASSGMRHYGDTGSGCRTAYGPSGCPTVHSFSMVGGLKKWAGTAEFQILKPSLPCCDIQCPATSSSSR